MPRRLLAESLPSRPPRFLRESLVILSTATTCTEPITAASDDTSTSTSADNDVEPWRASDLRSLAPRVGIGRWLGNLAGYRGEEGGACGLGGPDAFLEVDVPIAADVTLAPIGSGFQPRMHAAIYGDATADPVMMSLCVRGVPLTWSDVPAGTVLTVVIGTDPTDPALSLKDDALHDAFGFAVDVAFREVLPVGATCDLESRARCVTGSRCVVELEMSRGTCERVIGDSCFAPIPVAIVGQAGVEFDAIELTDVHEHSCTGVRMLERVYRLDLDPSVPTTAWLEVEAQHPDIGLAIRRGNCLAQAEIACVSARDLAPQLRVQIGDDAALGVPYYLFVELGSSWGEPWSEGRKPYDLRFEIVDG